MKWRLPLMLALLVAAAVLAEEEESAEETTSEPSAEGSVQSTDDACGIGHCDSCTNPAPKCAKCAENHVIDEKTGTCIKCPSHCKLGECYVSGTEAKCKTCKDRYYAADGGKSCLENSETCGIGKMKEEGEDKNEVCEKAIPGRIIKKQATCDKCSANCLKCRGPKTCTACKPFFALVNGGCIECPGGKDKNGISKCRHCKTDKQCDICTDSTFWDVETAECADCGKNCKACQNKDTCTKCSDKFVLSADKKCISTKYCQESSDGTGCTSCKAGYRVVDNECEACPMLEAAAACKAASNATLGRYFDEEKPRCEYCVKNCLDCDDDESCNECVEGNLFDGTDCKPCADVIAEGTTTIDQDMCQSCEDYYFLDEVCGECPEDISELVDKESCTDCGSNFFTEGTCELVTCAEAATEAECHACDKPYDADTEACGECEELVADIDNEPDCEACSTAEAPHFWQPDACEDVICAGTLDETKCNVCTDFYYNTEAEACQALDCTKAEKMFGNKPEMCNACKNMVHDADINECVDMTAICDTMNVADLVEVEELECKACQHIGVWWEVDADGLGTCSAAVCTDVTAITTKEECEACQANDLSYGFKWIPGEGDADGSCEDAYVCGEDLLGGADVEWQCSFCNDMFWEDETCMSYDCEYDNLDELEDKCGKCGMKFTADGCEDVDCDLELTTPEDCAACKAENYYWKTEGETETCEKYTSCDDAEVVIESQEICQACSSKNWVEGTCQVPTCDTAPATEHECKACDEFMWDSAEETCINLKCDDAPEDESTCGKCDEFYWTGKKCVAKLDCDKTIISDQYRCDACNEKTAESVKIWNDEESDCVECPHEHCNKCDEDKCTECEDTYVWDDEDKKCIECDASSSVLTKDQCKTCKGKGLTADDKCEKCIENCVKCDESIVKCDECVDGMIFDDGKCTDATFETAEECLTCGTSKQGNFFDADGYCLACDKNCVTCDAEGVCSACAADYWLDSDECKSCSGEDLDTEAKCKACGVTGQAWDGVSDCVKPCAADQYKEGDECKPCMAKCKKCSSATTCETCTPQHYFNKDKKSCETCDGQCLANECANEVGCKACVIGYHLDKKDGVSTCKKCETANCNKCDSTGATCEMCDNDHCLDKAENLCRTVDSDSKCKTCVLVEEKVSCTTCHNMDYLESTSACTDTNCADCDGDSSKCKTCKPGYFQESDECKACPGGKDCMHCEDESKCMTCKQSHYWADGACKVCSVASCMKCTGADSCDQCPPATFWDSANKKCTDCGDNCAKCTAADACTTCNPGSSLDANKACKKCGTDADNCHACDVTDTGFTCTTCKTTHYLNDKNCVECKDSIANCEYCSRNKAGELQCNKCVKGMVVADDKSGCKACDIGSCDYCIDPKPVCNDCKKNYTASENEEECYPTCYSCEAELDDPFCQDFNVTHPKMGEVPCPGIADNSAHCSFVRTFGFDSKLLVSAKRLCVNSTYNPTDDVCKDITTNTIKTEECKNGCKGNRCNHYTAGVAANYPAVSSLLLGLLFAYVTVNRG